VQECFAVLEKIEEINQNIKSLTQYFKKLERTGQFDQLEQEPDSAPVRITPKN
jgi:uncharacterized protein YjgD (DUF1641 family)